jgi:hypothetical protein
MPRLRPLKTKEEIDKVPPEKPVTIEIPPDDGTVELEANPFDEPPKEQPRTEAKEVRAAPEPEEDIADLKKQLEDMRAAKLESEKRIHAEINARQQAEERARREYQEKSGFRIRAEDAEYEAILNAIGAAKSEAEGAERDVVLASEAGDHKAVAEANRRIARAESKLAQLEDGKDAIERAKSAEAARLEEARRNPPQERQREPTVDQYIDSLPNLLPSQKEWLRSHPTTLSDQRLNMRLQGAHVEAEDQGLRPGSQKYFDYLETRLGFKADEEEGEEEEAPSRVTTPVAARPSKASHNPSTGRQTSTRVTLTEQQREAARMAGVDEITYAKGYLRMEQMKRDGTLN